MRTAIRFLVSALILTGPIFAQAQDEAAQICAAAEAHYVAVRAGDMKAIVGHHAPDFTFFTNDGALLWSFDTQEQQRSAFEQDPTFDSQKYIRHCSAPVYGETGVATYYLTGSETRAGKTHTGTWRVTEVWVRHQGVWKEAHHHESPLVGSLQD